MGLTNLTIPALAIDPVTPSTLYAGTFAGGVFKSSDEGASWISMNTGLTVARITSLAIDPATPSTIYAGPTIASRADFKTPDRAERCAPTSPGAAIIPPL